MRSTKRGFTIVELLIVIVVIAILAAITMVGYNGLTKSAKSASAIIAVDSVYKALLMYKETYGSYPKTPTEDGDANLTYIRCIGTGYIARDTTLVPACVWTNGGYTIYVDSSLSDEILKVVSSVPDVSSFLDFSFINGDSGATQHVQGIVYTAIDSASPYATTLDGEPLEYWLVYWLPEDRGCPKTMKGFSGSRSFVTQSDATEVYDTYSDGVSECAIALP